MDSLSNGVTEMCRGRRAHVDGYLRFWWRVAAGIFARRRVDGLTRAHSTVDVSPAYDRTLSTIVLQQGAWLVAADFN